MCLLEYGELPTLKGPTYADFHYQFTKALAAE